MVFNADDPAITTELTATPHVGARLLGGASRFAELSGQFVLGDTSFDESYWVGASHEAAARSCWNEIRVSQLKLLLETFDEVRIGDGSARCGLKFDMRSTTQVAKWSRQVVFAVQLFTTADD